MASQQSIWFRIGYALERARRPPPTAKRPLAGFAERMASAPGRSEDRSSQALWPSADQLIDSGVGVVVTRALKAWRPRRNVGLVRLLRAGAAGVGASLLVDLIRPLLSGRTELPTLDRYTADRILAGAGQGLVYGGLIEPRIPGPALVKGALYGSAEYATDQVGGLSHVLGAHAPQGRIPGVSHLLEHLDPHDRAFLEHLIFGIALALLYGSSPSSNGIRVEADAR